MTVNLHGMLGGGLDNLIRAIRGDCDGAAGLARILAAIDIFAIHQCLPRKRCARRASACSTRTGGARGRGARDTELLRPGQRRVKQWPAYLPSSRQLFSLTSTPCFFAADLMRPQAASRSSSDTPST